MPDPRSPALRAVPTGTHADNSVQDLLTVAGLVPLSTVDWPGRLVATVFTQGCPWRCGYCQNPGLIDPTVPAAVPWPKVTGLLERRRGLLDGVVFTGGEPTLQSGLGDAMRQVRDLGFAVGLHTGGAWPARLARVLPLVDWVGLDIKHIPEQYPAVTGAGPSGAAAWRSLELVQAAGIDYEIRTTVDPTVHERFDVLTLGDRLRAAGVIRWVLQEARPDGASEQFGAALADRRLSDVLHEDDLPGVERRSGP